MVTTWLKWMAEVLQSVCLHRLPILFNVHLLYLIVVHSCVIRSIQQFQLCSFLLFIDLLPLSYCAEHLRPNDLWHRNILSADGTHVWAGGSGKDSARCQGLVRNCVRHRMTSGHQKHNCIAIDYILWVFSLGHLGERKFHPSMSQNEELYWRTWLVHGHYSRNK